MSHSSVALYLKEIQTAATTAAIARIEPSYRAACTVSVSVCLGTECLAPSISTQCSCVCPVRRQEQDTTCDNHDEA
jgi:hypothetical protein